MKKISGAFYFIVIACAVFSLSGCSGSSSKNNTAGTAEVAEVAVLTSPALEVYRDYKIIKGASISGMDGAQYYVAGDIGDENSQATLNLGFSGEFDVNSTFAVVNVSTNRVVFAYDPKGNTDEWKTSGNIATTGGYRLSYNGLTIEQETAEVSAAVGPVYSSSSINYIKLNSTSATITKSSSSKSVPKYDYVWHAEPDSNGEYFSEGLYGDIIDSYSVDDGVYIARDVRYLTENANFTGTATKDGETEYAAYYSDSVASEAASNYGSAYGGPYIFATLPRTQNSSLSSVTASMTHSASEAYNNPVLHIAEAGIYSLSGTWNGQIYVEADAVIILNGVTVICTVAPAIIFDAAEYGLSDETSVASTWKTLGKTLLDDLTDANANLVIIADGTTNTFTGSNVYRILKAEPKSSATKVNGKDISDQKKLYKMDGAFYSYVSLAICGENDGTGILNINSSTFEGLGSELHLTVEGGKINVTAPDDGINVNEDNISVFTQLGGTLTIKSTYGDGIDSNGYIAINGGNLNISAGTQKTGTAGEAGLDVEKDYYISSSAKYTWTAAGSSGSSNFPIITSGDISRDVTWREIQQDNLNSTSTSTSTTVNKEESYKYDDANILTAAKQTEKGVTAINVGRGNNLSFIQSDTDTKARNISTSGNVFRLDRKINTFSGIRN